MYDRILVTMDGSPVSGRAPEETIKLVGLSGGKLRVIAVVDSPLRHLPDYVVRYNPEPLYGAALEAADGVLAKTRERAKTSNVKGVTFDRVYQERANEEIVERIELEAQASDVDVVVMGTHGCRGMRRLMLGNVAEGLAHVALRPVLLACDE